MQKSILLFTVQTPLPSTTLTHAAFYLIHQFVVLQPPIGSYKQFLRRLRSKPLKHDIGAKPLYIVDYCLYVVVERKKCKIGRVFGILLRHSCATDKLQLMQFKRRQRQARKFCCLQHEPLPVLARQAKDYMRSHRDTARCGAFHSFGSTLVVVSSVYTQQRIVIGALYAVLYKDKRTLLQRDKVVEQFIGHAVGTRAYHYPYTAIHFKSLFIPLLEDIQRGIGIGVCLEIGKITHRRILVREERYALLHLLLDRKMTMAIRGIERLVIAICATAPPHLAVAVGTCETAVKGYLLHLAPENGMHIRAELVIVKDIFAHEIEYGQRYNKRTKVSAKRRKNVVC